MPGMQTLTWPFTSWDSTVDWLLGPPLRIVLIIIGALILRWVLHRAVRSVVDNAVERADDHERSSFERMLHSATGANQERRRQRALTMGTVLRSLSTFTIATIALLTIMAEVGLPLAPLLTSAGIGGIALGFGAQALVKDFLSGIFMIIEDQYGVGDVIDTGEATGTVEVTLDGTPLESLNELECAEDGSVYANIWRTFDIAKIDPATGTVTEIIDAEPLWNSMTERERDGADVLNGIAQIPGTDRFLVTGKLWPSLTN